MQLHPVRRVSVLSSGRSCLGTYQEILGDMPHCWRPHDVHLSIDEGGRRVSAGDSVDHCDPLATRARVLAALRSVLFAEELSSMMRRDVARAVLNGTAASPGGVAANLRFYDRRAGRIHVSRGKRTRYCLAARRRRRGGRGGGGGGGGGARGGGGGGGERNGRRSVLP